MLIQSFFICYCISKRFLGVFLRFCSYLFLFHLVVHFLHKCIHDKAVLVVTEIAFGAILVKACQKCHSVSFVVCFSEKISYSGFMKACSQFSSISRRAIVATHMCGSLSVTVFRRAVPSDRKSSLTNFLSAACSFRLLIQAVIRGFCSVTFRTISSTEIEYFGSTVTLRGPTIPSNLF